MFDTDPAAKAAAVAAVPTGELHAPQEVARVVVLLCSAQTRGVTGATLVADGGLCLLAPGNHGD
jgi:enoyl-[acyl-carrier protein] reductase III